MTLKIRTITGDISPDDLGLTLMHEHLFTNGMRETRGLLLHDVEMAKLEVDMFLAKGGSTIVDCTPAGVGRDPKNLLRVARETEVNVVMGAGFYRDPYLDDRSMNERDVDQLAEVIVRELEDQVDDTGLRAGIIGEVGCNEWFASAMEERVLRAAARAQLRTGAAITTHAARWPVGRAQLRIFTDEGVDPSRVIIGHSDFQMDAEDYHLELAEAGAYVEFDTIAHARGEYDLARTVRYIQNLIEHGHLERILISQDICFPHLLTTLGGPGFTFVLGDFRERLRAGGIDDTAFHQIMVTNPARALAF